MNVFYIIYDGSCGFCDRTIMFFAKNDRKDHFVFVSSLSEFGKKILTDYGMAGLEQKTIIFIKNKSEIYIKSSAIKNILLNLPRYSLFARIMSIIPLKILNYIYDYISENRKKILNKKSCEIPDIEIRKKFIF